MLRPSNFFDKKAAKTLMGYTNSLFGSLVQ